jgi:hypothetical protein
MRCGADETRARLQRLLGPALGPGFVDALGDYLDAREAELAERLRLEGGSTSPFMTVLEAAAFSGAKRQRIYDLFDKGVLTRYGTDHARLVSRADLVAYVENNRR